MISQAYGTTEIHNQILVISRYMRQHSIIWALGCKMTTLQLGTIYPPLSRTFLGSFFALLQVFKYKAYFAQAVQIFELIFRGFCNQRRIFLCWKELFLTLTIFHHVILCASFADFMCFFPTFAPLVTGCMQRRCKEGKDAVR